MLRRFIFISVVVLCFGLVGCEETPPEVNPEDRLENPEWACGRWVSTNPESNDYIEITNTNLIWRIGGQGSMNLAEYLKSDYVKVKTKY